MHAVRITVICDECVRIEYAPHGRFCDHPSLFAIHGPGGDPSRPSECRTCLTTEAGAGSKPITIETSRLRLDYTPDGRPPHAGNMRALIDHPNPPADVETEHGRVVWTPGTHNRHNLGGTLSTLDGLRSEQPLGDGLLARDGWHVVDDSARHLLIDGWAATRDGEGLSHNLDWYLFAYGADYPAALNALSVIAGRVPMPRRYALGSWYSRYWPYTSEEFRGIVDEFAVQGFPLDVLVLDMDWHKEGWTGWSWNRTLLPDAEELLEWLHARGIAVTLNLHPADGVGSHEDRYARFMHAIGREPDGSVVPFDAGDRAYMRALFEQVHVPLERPPGRPDAGVDFWWVDWQQQRLTRSIPGLANIRWLNHLYFQHTRRGRADRDDGLRGESFSRWAGDDRHAHAETEWGAPETGGWGDHRHPIHFSGDAHTGWEMLAFQVKFSVAAGNIGCFYWSHDIGGHFGPRIEEAMARWVQFGALSAALRLHSARDSALDRRPWTYEERFTSAMREAYALRSRLMPYLYTQVRACYEHTLPLLRPMCLQAPGKERAAHVWHQYTIGTDLLVAPIVRPGRGEACVSARAVWFPPARDGQVEAAWHRWSTGEAHAPNSDAIVSASISEMPLYVRGGVLMPLAEPGKRMASPDDGTITLLAFPGMHDQVESSVLYEDDGVSLAYERTDGVGSAQTPLEARWEQLADGTLRLHATIGPTRGTFTGQSPSRRLQLHLGALHAMMNAQVNGQAVEWTFDPVARGGQAAIDLGEQDIRTPVSVQLDCVPADPRLIAHRTRLAHLGSVLNKSLSVAHAHQAVTEAMASAAGDRELLRDVLAIGAGVGTIVEGPVIRVIDAHGWIDDAAVRVSIVDEVGGARVDLLDQTLRLIQSGGHARAADVPLPPRPLDVPGVGVVARRVAIIQGRLHGHAFELRQEVEQRARPLTGFAVLGPFAWDWRWKVGECTHPPELGPIDYSKHIPGRDGVDVGWRNAASGPKWAVDLRHALQTRGGLAYAATLIQSPRAQPARLRIDCSDKVEVFLNGAKVSSVDTYTAHAAAPSDIDLPLRAGANTLLIKVTDGGGGWGFTPSIEAEGPISHEPPPTI